MRILWEIHLHKLHCDKQSLDPDGNPDIFFFNDTATTEIYILSLHDALPIYDGGYYTVKDCVTIDVLPRTPGNNVYVGFMVWSNFTATKCRGLVSLNQVIKEIICLQPHNHYCPAYGEGRQ